MTITALPVPPLRSDPASFAVRADAFLAALPVFVTQANAVAQAMNLNDTTDTSATSSTVGLGAKTFTVTAGKSFLPGMYLVAADTTAPSTNSMFGQVTSYSGTSLVLNVLFIRGSGTKTAWQVSQSGPGGATPGANSDITSLLGLTTALSVAQGGTGSTTPLAAQVALGVKTSATGSVAGTAGTTAQRDVSPVIGFTRFNTTLNSPEVWNGTAWAQLLVNETTGVDLLGASLNNVSAVNGGQLAGIRNKIINGKMDIAQRGTSFPGLTGTIGAYTVDRFLYGANLAATVTVSQQLDAPPNNEFQNSLRVAVTTADTAIAAADFAVLNQRIEGFNARDLIGKTFTLSFWVRSSKTGIHCASLKNSAGDRSYVAEYSIVTANTWEYKTVTVAGGLITAGTWNWTTGIGIQVEWALAAGTNTYTTPNAWQTSNSNATASQVNCMDTIGNIFAITGVQLEVGAVATPFEHRPIGAELALCQRYYEKSYDVGVVPGTGGNLSGYAAYGWNSINRPLNSVAFAVEKRISATVFIYNSNSGASGTMRNADAATDVASSVVFAGSKNFVAINGGAGTLGNAIHYHWTASAEL